MTDVFISTDAPQSPAVSRLLYDADSIGQPRTQVFQLSTAATGLTEIQQLFTDQQS